MAPEVFVTFRKDIHKTQNEMSQLLGVSVKAIRSYEQGWRRIPAHVERHLLYLVASREEIFKTQPPCWQILQCPDELRCQCPAWEFNAGSFCWFINGTICGGVVHPTWAEKIKICRKCEAFPEVLNRS